MPLISPRCAPQSHRTKSSSQLPRAGQEPQVSRGSLPSNWLALSFCSEFPHVCHIHTTPQVGVVPIWGHTSPPFSGGPNKFCVRSESERRMQVCPFSSQQPRSATHGANAKRQAALNRCTPSTPSTGYCVIAPALMILHPWQLSICFSGATTHTCHPQPTTKGPELRCHLRSG